MSKAEKFIEDCTNHCSNELCAVEDRFGKKVISYHEWLTPEQALRAVEIEREELIDTTFKWLNAHILDYTISEPYWGGIVVNNDLFSALKKAMKGE